MRRRVRILALLCAASALLSACDKCGGLQELRAPSIPKSCSGEQAR